MQIKIEFNVDGFINNPQRETVEIVINPSDEDYENSKFGVRSPRLAFIGEKQGDFMFVQMPTYAVLHGYSNLKILKK